MCQLYSLSSYSSDNGACIFQVEQEKTIYFHFLSIYCSNLCFKYLLHIKCYSLSSQLSTFSLFECIVSLLFTQTVACTPSLSLCFFFSAFQMLLSLALSGQYIYFPSPLSLPSLASSLSHPTLQAFCIFFKCHE